MRIARVITVLVMGALILGACAGPATAPPATGPAAFTTSNFTLAPGRVRPGEDTTVGVWVKNTGGQTGTYNVEVKVDGDIAKTENVTLAGGKSQKVIFTVVVPLIGIHNIAIDNFTGILLVGVGGDY